jgi:hypothetical protein
MIAGTPTVVMVLNAVLAGVIAAVAALRFGVLVPDVLGFGALGFLLAILLQSLYARATIASGFSEYRPLFPSSKGDR